MNFPPYPTGLSKKSSETLLSGKPWPLISIVTPSFNQADYLEEAILSVVSQGYPNLEYIIIDGGSTDGSVEIIKKYEKWLTYWVSEPDSGHGDALNKGFSQASGEIMAWLNSDDKYTPWAFEVVATVLRQFAEVNWLVGFNSFWSTDGVLTEAWRNPRNIYDFLIGNYAWVQQESVFWRKELWEKAGGYINRDYQYMVDGELWTRYFLHAELYSIECILGGYRRQPNNRATHNYQLCWLEMEKAISEMRHHCQVDILKISSMLKVIQKLSGFPLLRYFPISYICKKSIFRSMFKQVEYENIFFNIDGWEKRKLPFTIR